MDGHGSHIDTDFMWACKQAKIRPLYLPPHSSHILQPLDLAGFSVVKSKYRRDIAALATLNDAAPVKKARFIECYNRAREAGLSSKIIKAGWKATGLSPYSPAKVARSAQLTGRAITPPPAVPPIYMGEIVLRTPKKPHDIYKATQHLARRGGLPRCTRAYLAKTTKAFATDKTRLAQLQVEIQRLKYLNNQYTDLQSRKRKRVDPNKRFHNVEAIRAAIAAAAAETAKKATTATQRAAAKVAAETASKTMKSMCTSWQL